MEIDLSGSVAEFESGRPRAGGEATIRSGHLVTSLNSLDVYLVKALCTDHDKSRCLYCYWYNNSARAREVIWAGSGGRIGHAPGRPPSGGSALREWPFRHPVLTSRARARHCRILKLHYAACKNRDRLAGPKSVSMFLATNDGGW